MTADIQVGRGPAPFGLPAGPFGVRAYDPAVDSLTRLIVLVIAIAVLLGIAGGIGLYLTRKR